MNKTENTNSNDSGKNNYFKFNFSQKLKEEIIIFSNKFYKEHRKIIKNEWNLWVEHNKSFILKEKMELEIKGYKGSIDDFIGKLFFSVKYYYIKKDKKENVNQTEIIIIKDEINNNNNNKIEKNEIAPKITKKIISFINKHINSLSDFKETPAISYLNFINCYKEDIFNEITDSKTYNNIKLHVIFNKIKKIYKNYHYNMRNEVKR